MISLRSRRLDPSDISHLWLLAGLAFAIGPHLRHLPLLISLPTAGLLLWRLLYQLGIARLPSRYARLGLTILAMLCIYASFNTLFGRQAGVGLLIIMLGLKLMEMNNMRDITIVCGLGYFIVTTVFMFDQTIMIGGYLLLAVILLTTALTSFSRPKSNASPWLSLRKAVVMLIQAAPIAVLLFVLFPRIPGPLWSMPNDSISASTGVTDSMSPGSFTDLSNDDSVAFRVLFKGPIPDQNKQYWRGPVLIEFDGRTWSNPAHKLFQTSGKFTSQPYILYKPEYLARGEPVHYNITLEPHQQRWLFALDLPGEVPPESRLTIEYEMVSINPVSQLFSYDINSYLDYSLDKQSRPALTRYLQLPAGSGLRARQLAENFFNQSDSPHSLVQLALQYIREKPFYYTRIPPLLTKDPVDQFLFESRRGYCEHYASAFVFLMRAAGIPARVVTGYQGSEFNPLGDYYIVRQSNAHAWAEVWLPGEGWVRIDPTAVIPPERVENISDLQRIAPDIANVTAISGWARQLWRQLGYGMDNLNHYWNQWIVNYNQDVQKLFMNRLGLEDIDWRGMVTLLAGGVSLVLILLAVYSLRIHNIKIDPVQSAYRKFCRKLARRGLVRQPQEAAGNFSRRAELALPDCGAAIDHITSLYQELRYGPRPPADGLQRLRHAIRQF